MKNVLIFLVCILICCFSSCSNAPQKAPLQFNSYIESYTTGSISRNQKIQLVFAHPIAKKFQTNGYLQEVIHITPHTDGLFTVLNNREVLFTPDEFLKEDTRYDVHISVEDLFDCSRPEGQFDFMFRTIEPNIQFEQISMESDISENGDTLHHIAGYIHTADIETQDALKEVVGFSEPVNIEWGLAPEGNKFYVRIMPKVWKEDAEVIEMVTKRNWHGYEPKKIADLRFPPKNAFEVYDIDVSKNQHRSVEIIFSKYINQSQDFKKFIHVTPKADIHYQVEGNKLILSGFAEDIDTYTIRVNDGIKSVFSHTDLMYHDSPSDMRYKEIHLNKYFPSFEFTDNALIIPKSEDYSIPFYATNLRGVIVRIFRIPDSNILQIIRDTNLKELSNIADYGKQLCREVVFLDTQGDYILRQPNLFNLDLTNYITPEPGALYKLELEFNQDLSNYPSDTYEKKSRSEVLRDNASLRKQEITLSRNGEKCTPDYPKTTLGNNDGEVNDPTKAPYYENRKISRLLYYTNLSLTATKSQEDHYHITVYDTQKGLPIGDVSTTIYDAQLELIDERPTWDNGTVDFRENDRRPYFVMAEKDGQKSYLSLNQHQMVSLDELNTEGVATEQGVNGFIFLNRGYYPPGDSIHIGFVIQDKCRVLEPNEPVICEILQPNGEITWSDSQRKKESNLVLFKTDVPFDTPLGTYTIVMKVGGNTYSKTCEVDNIYYNKYNLEWSNKKEMIRADQAWSSKLTGHNLVGAKEKLQYKVSICKHVDQHSFDQYTDYDFIANLRDFQNKEYTLTEGWFTDRMADSITNQLMVEEHAPGMLRCDIKTQILRNNKVVGQYIEQKSYAPYNYFVGLKPTENIGQRLATNKTYQFDVVSVNYLGKPQANRTLRAKIYRIDPLQKTCIKEVDLTSDVEGKAHFDVRITPYNMGHYLIQVVDEQSKHRACLQYQFGGNPKTYQKDLFNREHPRLDVSLDKDHYVVGESVKVSFPSTPDTYATISVHASGGVFERYQMQCEGDRTIFELPVTSSLKPNAYITVACVRPYKHESDRPVQEYGVCGFRVVNPTAQLHPIIEIEEDGIEGQNYPLTIYERDGRPMDVVVSVVDNNTLQLTNYSSPNPWEYFNQKERLTIDYWDNYYKLAAHEPQNALQTYIVGGDRKGSAFESINPLQGNGFSQHFDVVSLKRNERKKFYVQPGAFNGQVKCNVVAVGADNKFGHTEKAFHLYSPITMDVHAPNIIKKGDTLVVELDVKFNEQAKQQGKLHVKTMGGIKLLGDKEFVIDNSTNNKTTYQIPITTINKRETGVLCFKIEWGKSQFKSSHHLDIKNPVANKEDARFFALGPYEKTQITLNEREKSQENIYLELSSLITSDYSMGLLANRVFYTDHITQVLGGSIAQVSSQSFLLPRHQTLRYDEQVILALEDLKNYSIEEGGFSVFPHSKKADAYASIIGLQFLIKAKKVGYVVSDKWIEEQVRYQRDLLFAYQDKGPGNERTTQALRMNILSKLPAFPYLVLKQFSLLDGLTWAEQMMLIPAFLESGKPDTSKALWAEGKIKFERVRVEDLSLDDQMQMLSLLLNTRVLVEDNMDTDQLAFRMLKFLRNYDRVSISQYFVIGALRRYFTVMNNNPIYCRFGYKGDEQVIKSKKGIWKNQVMIKDKGDFLITNQGSDSLFVTLATITADEERDRIARGKNLRIERWIEDRSGKEVASQELKKNQTYRLKCLVINDTDRSIHRVYTRQVFPEEWTSVSLLSEDTDQSYVKDSYWVADIPQLGPKEQIEMVYEFTPSYGGSIALESFTAACFGGGEAYATSGEMRLHIAN